MELVINNRIISAPIIQILEQVKKEINGRKLKYIKQENNDNVLVTCPLHKDGQESHPSCRVYSNRYDPNTPYGVAHCFACGMSVSLPRFIEFCFDEELGFGEEWLLERFGNTLVYDDEFLLEIELNKKPEQQKFLDEKILDQYAYYHPYMYERKLTKKVIDKFHIGYDKNREAITFPVWDINNNLVMITARSVNTKHFWIDKDIQKPVYLLNYIVKEHISTVYVCESQINALTMWSYGYPAIGLIGTGSKNQYDILNKSGITSYILLFDGDEAGRKGAERFKKNIRKDVFITDIRMFDGKDVNDLSKQELKQLIKV